MKNVAKKKTLYLKKGINQILNLNYVKKLSKSNLEQKVRILTTTKKQL